MLESRMLSQRLQQAAHQRPSSPVGDPATGKFYTTTDGRIIDPMGNTFIPIGANLGSTIGGNQQGTATGHSADVKAWGWNAIRLFVVQNTGISWSLPAQSVTYTGSPTNGYNQVFQIIDGIVNEYTAKGIVVLIDNHDLFELKTSFPGTAKAAEGLANPYIEEINQFWRDCAARYKNNTYVWYNLDNEPIGQNNQAWVDLHTYHLDLVRGIAPDNIIVMDAMVGAGDVGPQTDLVGVKLTTDPTMWPVVARDYKNIVLSMHNYGGYDMYTSVSKYLNYVQSVHDKLQVPLVIGEVGYTWDSTQADAGPSINNKNGAISAWEAAATTKTGVFWWHGSMNTKMSLKTNGGGFYTGGLNVNLSEAGQRLWNLGHDIGSEPQNLVCTQVDQTQAISMTWDPPLKDQANLTGYKLYRNSTLIATLDATASSYTDTTSVYGTYYLYQLRSITSGVERTTSYYCKVIAMGGSAPAPTNLTASSSASSPDITLRWTAPSPITGTLNGYRIYRNGGVVSGGTPWTYGAYFTDYNRTHGATYTYKVAAIVDNFEQPSATITHTML